MSKDESMIESTWAEARDLIRRLEGTSVQRFAVKAGDYEIEMGLGVSPAARGASGAFSAITEVDNRVPVLSPLVGTFYRAAQPGAKAFVNEGDTVDLGQAVCIVEAMKLMNEVAAGEGGKVVEIAVEDGDPVEFEQVLMYLEPASE